MRSKQEAINQLGKRLQMLLKKAPDVARVLAEAIYAEFGTHSMDSTALMDAAKRIQKQIGPVVPRLEMNSGGQQHNQGRGSLWTTEGGVIVQEKSARPRDMSARHDALRTKRRERKNMAQMSERQRRMQAKEAQKRHSKMQNLTLDDGKQDTDDSRHRRLKMLQDKKNDVWYRKAQMEAELNEQAKYQAKEQAREQRMETKAVLEAQMKQHEDVSQKRRQEKQAYDQNVLADVERHKQDQQHKFMREAAKAKSQADDQLAQRLDRRRQKEESQRQKMHEDESLLRNIEIQQRKDSEKAMVNAKKERQAMAKVKQENVQQMAQVRQEKVNEKQQDMKLARQYEQLEAERDNKRQAHITKMQNDVKTKMARFDHLQQESDKVAKNNEIKAQREEKEMERRTRSEETRKKQKKDQRMFEQKKALYAQREEKRIRQQQEKDEDKMHAREWQREGDKMNKQENEFQHKRKVNAAKQQHFLKQQMALKEKMEYEHNLMGLTPRERALNAGLLKQLGCNEIADRTRSRAQQLEDQQQKRDKMMMERPAGMSSTRMHTHTSRSTSVTGR